MELLREFNLILQTFGKTIIIKFKTYNKELRETDESKNKTKTDENIAEMRAAFGGGTIVRELYSLAIELEGLGTSCCRTKGYESKLKEIEVWSLGILLGI